MNQQETIRYSSIQDIMIISNGPGRYPAHWHNAAEFILAMRDGCRYRVRDVEYTLKKGDILLVWPRELHETVFQPEEGAFFIQFSDRLLENNLDLAISMRLLSRQKKLAGVEHPELTGQLAEWMMALRESFLSREPFSETRCKVLIYQMLIRIGDHAYRTRKEQMEGEDRFSGEAWGRMREACSYIEAHFTDGISQTEVAAAVGLSVCYFSRLFRKYMQISFPQYVAHVRVRAAARLLGGTDLPITDCAGQAGFQSITAFNKSFLEIMGTSPRDYRKMYRNFRDQL